VRHDLRVTWTTRLNAEIYDGFVREHGLYDFLNATLVEHADVGAASRVLDLACGTGATTLACLRVLGPDAEVVGVDASSDMLDVARANVRDPRARFLHVAAGRLSAVLDGVFERVACNAAFWQFPAPAAVLEELSGLVAPGGRFVFNVPAERVRGERSPLHPFQVALASAIAEATGAVLPPPTELLDLDVLEADARRGGFELDAVERITYDASQGELMELMSIPAMIAPLTEGATEQERESILEAAARDVDAAEGVRVPWLVLVLRRHSG